MRILKTLFPFLFLVLAACNTGEAEKDYFYVIESPAVYSKDSLESPETVFYGQNNFILYDSKTILYHNKSVSHWCGTGIDFTKPDRLFLAPEDLIKLKPGELKHFLKTKFNWGKTHGRFCLISVSSSTDTIKNPAYTTLLDFQKRHKNLSLVVRKWTEEEEHVASAKMRKRPYEPHKIKWKNGFSEGSESLRLIQFLPPVVENTEKPVVKQSLTKYFYPNMSACGGALYGYYDDTTLVEIDSKHGGEFSLTYQTVKYDHGKITRFIYGEEFPKWDDYHKKHPNSTEIDPKNLTYTNDRVEIDFYPVRKIRTFSNKKRVKNVITEEKIQQLIDCAKQMESELASEKMIQKD